MSPSQIETYKDTISYLGVEVANQSANRRTLNIELGKVAFFKLAKLIQFCIRNNPNERFANEQLPEDLKEFHVRINGLLTKVTRI